MKPSERWRSLVTYWAERVSLPPDVLFAQMMAESSGNPSARSTSGAMGLLQLMPGTAREMGCGDPLNPDQNLKAGSEYLARQLANVRLETKDCEIIPEDAMRFALAAYNAGFGYVRAAIRELRARQMPLTWENFKVVFPSTSVRGLKPDARQAIGYSEKILPPTAHVPVEQ